MQRLCGQKEPQIEQEVQGLRETREVMGIVLHLENKGIVLHLENRGFTRTMT